MAPVCSHWLTNTLCACVSSGSLERSAHLGRQDGPPEAVARSTAARGCARRCTPTARSAGRASACPRPSCAADSRRRAFSRAASTNSTENAISSATSGGGPAQRRLAVRRAPAHRGQQRRGREHRAQRQPHHPVVGQPRAARASARPGRRAAANAAARRLTPSGARRDRQQHERRDQHDPRRPDADAVMPAAGIPAVPGRHGPAPAPRARRSSPAPARSATRTREGVARGEEERHGDQRGVDDLAPDLLGRVVGPRRPEPRCRGPQRPGGEGRGDRRRRSGQRQFRADGTLPRARARTVAAASTSSISSTPPNAIERGATAAFVGQEDEVGRGEAAEPAGRMIDHA